MNTEQPFASSVWEYRRAGWMGAQPVGRGPRRKAPPFTGFTGYTGVDPSGADVQAWCDGPEAAYNIGLHIPAGLLVPDLDAYHGGAESLAALEARVGQPLPPTISSTSRGQHDLSRHRFYRATLPEGRVWKDHPGPGIDSLHLGHRYAVVWPSVHPDSGEPYVWYDAEGEPYEGVPDPAWAAKLPEAWVMELSKPGSPMEGTAAGDTETLDVISKFRQGAPCGCVARALHAELDRIAAAAVSSAGGIHDPGKLHPLVAFGLEGHAGVAAALSHHQEAYVRARVEHRGETEGHAGAAWWRQVRGSVGKKLAANGGVIEQMCSCGRPRQGGQTLVATEGAAPQAGAPGRRKEDQLPPPGVPLGVARRVQDRFISSGLRLCRWRGDWYEHRVAHWSAVAEEAVRERLYLETEPCWYLHRDERKDIEEERPWNPTTRTVNGVLDALGTAVVRRPDASEEERCIAFANGVLARAGGARELAPHTPERFNLWSLPYAYDPAATCPTWLAFLGEQVPDVESRQLLREWFGYVVSGRTDLQKILHMYGVRRSGKSTILRVLRALIGAENTASVSIKGLTGAFGVQPLIGKSLALIADANWKVREVETACEAMKNISGEDPLDVERKHRTTWSGILRARFVVVGNDEPEFRDPSGALLGRMIHVHFSRSVYGREDPTLTGRLLAELPGILNWALDGLDTLEQRGYFATPKASAEAEEDIARSTSPVAGFLTDCVTFMDPTMGLSEWLDDLYEAYRKWCGGQGIRVEMTKAAFSKALRSAVAGRAVARRARPTPKAAQQQIFDGLTLLPPDRGQADDAAGAQAPPLGQPAR